MNARLTHLRVKLNTLADESRRIRCEELKIVRKRRELTLRKNHHSDEVCRLKAHDYLEKTADSATFLVNDLAHHRRIVVRKHARATHLAYGFLRGKSYISMEINAKSAPDWAEIASIVKRFGTADEFAALNAWIDLGEQDRRFVQEMQTPALATA